MTISPPLYVAQRVFHVQHYVRDVGFSVMVRGIDTNFLSERFRAGESIRAIATDYGVDDDDVLAALRWELWPRETRAAAVRREVERQGLTRLAPKAQTRPQ